MAFIDLSKLNVGATNPVGTRNVFNDKSNIASAIVNVGDKMASIFGEMAVKERENDIKQSAWDSHSNYSIKMKQDILDADAKIDGNGNIVSKINPDGTTEYELGEDGKPISYTNYITKKMNENLELYRNAFDGDQDKINYFNNISNNFNQSTLIESRIVQNQKINANTMDRIDKSFDAIASNAIVYDSPDFLQVANKEFSAMTLQARDIGGSVNFLATEKLINKKGHDLAANLAEKALSHAQTDLSSDKMLSEFAGHTITANPELKKYFFEFGKTMYSEEQLDVMYSKIENQNKDNKSKVTFFSMLKPEEQQKWIENILKIKFDEDKNSMGNFTHSVNELLAFPGTVKGRTNIEYTIQNLAEMNKSPLWKKSFDTVQTGNMGLELAKNMTESFLADQIYQSDGDIKSFPLIVKKAVEKAKNWSLQISNNDPEVAKYLSSASAGSTIIAPLEQKFMALANTLASELHSDPNAYFLKYNINKGIPELERKALMGNKEASDKLNFKIKNFYRTSGTDLWEQPVYVSDGTAKMAAESIIGNAETGDYLASATSLLKMSYASQATGLELMRQVEKKGVKAPMLGALAMSLLGGGEMDDKKLSLSTNLMRITDKKIKETNAKLEADIPDPEKRSEKLIKINKYISDSLKSALPSIYFTGKNSRTAALGGYIFEYIKESVKAKLAEKPDSDTKDLTDSIIKNEILSKVNDFSSSPGMFGTYDGTVPIRGIFKKSNTTQNMKERAETELIKLGKLVQSGELKIDYTKVPKSFHLFLAGIGKPAVPTTDKDKALTSRFKFMIQSRSVVGDDTTGEIAITDGNYNPTPLFVIDKNGSSRVYSIPGFAK